MRTRLQVRLAIGLSGFLALVNLATAATHYVNLNNPSPVAPYLSWNKAARNIQDAVDAASAGDVILVTNGVYATGAREVSGTSNRVAVTKAVTVQSVNGPGLTLIDGAGSTRCAYLTNGATLVGFLLTNGFAGSGGGVFCESASGVVSNCVLTGNSATYGGGGAYSGTLNNCTLTWNSAAQGGGVSYGILNNCTLTGNSAIQDAPPFPLHGSGGGAFGGELNNCTLTGNSADYWGGGAFGGVLKNCTLTGNSALQGGGGVAGVWSMGGSGIIANLYNCIVYGNSGASGQANYDSESFLSYCCTTPLPDPVFIYDGNPLHQRNTAGNITNAPAFVDPAGGNFRLQSNSPCINAGSNADAPAGPDLEGNPRIAGGTVDIGAYEFQTPMSSISYAWLRRYGLPIDDLVDTADPDGDGLNNWQEWGCLTDPTNSLSVLRLLSPAVTSTNVTVTWQSVAGVSYIVGRSTNASSPLFFIPLATGIYGQAGTTAYTDTNAVLPGPYFYRVGIAY